jgi:hypothetical protein
MDGGPLSNPILIACPKKRKRIFTESATFSLGGGVSTGNAQVFLDQSGAGRMSKMYFYYCRRWPIGKGNFGETGKIPRFVQIRTSVAA